MRPRSRFSYLLLVMTLAFGLSSSFLVAANTTGSSKTQVKFCVWDPVGKSGPFMNFFKGTVAEAFRWGYELKMEAYTDEGVAANDFRSGQCDAVLLTNIMAKDFLPFTAAFGAPGGIRSLEELKTLSASLNSPKAVPLISYNNYELGGLYPIGEIYTFVQDRSKVRIEDVSGRKVSILNNDLASLKFVEMVGASPVHTSLATWAGQFNNGNVDVMFGPALAYNTFELYKGLGEQGGIIDHSILYAVMEVVVNNATAPEGLAEHMREHALTRFNELENTVKQAYSEIPQKYWVQLDDPMRAEYENMIKRVRLSLRDEKAYDAKAISILWKIRCKYDPSRTECATKE
jgi:hypothetical protein